MTIRIISFDFDGSLFHNGYISSTDKDVIASNLAFLNTIKTTASSYLQTFVLDGSNRQSAQIDRAHFFNAQMVWVGSCFPAIAKVTAYLGAKFHPFLLADLYGKLKPGVSYNRAMDAQKNPHKKINHAECIIDEFKITLLYAQIHEMAQMIANLPKPDSDEAIEFNFYDDRDDILDSLNDFYNQYQMLLPSNVTLNLHRYKGEEVLSKGKIKGTGFIDTNYGQTVKDMVDFYKKHHPKKEKIYIPYCFNMDSLTHQTPFERPDPNACKREGKPHFSSHSFFSSADYQASYATKWGRAPGSSSIQKTKELLKDYTKDGFVFGAFVGRVVSGHWNRHHVAAVTKILAKIKTNEYEQVEDIIIELKDLNPTRGGSLDRRIRFIEEQVSAKQNAASRAFT